VFYSLAGQLDVQIPQNALKPSGRLCWVLCVVVFGLLHCFIAYSRLYNTG